MSVYWVTDDFLLYYLNVNVFFVLGVRRGRFAVYHDGDNEH